MSIHSSGGALTSTLGDPTTDDPTPPTAAADEPGRLQVTPDSAVGTADTDPVQTTAQQVEATPVAVSVEAVDVGATATRPRSGDAANRSDDAVATAISALPPAFTSLVGVGGRVPPGDDRDDHPVVGAPPATGTALVAARPAPVAPDAPTPPAGPAPTFTAALVAALAPFVAPSPGSPVDAPTSWVLLAWVRRQSERSLADERQPAVALPMQTETVGPDPVAPGAVVDRVDRTTGRVVGHLDVSGDVGGSAAATYALVGHVDARQGTVSVDADSGQWTFTPSPAARLASHLNLGDGTARFAVVVANGQTVDVRAPVDPAEAVVTGTIDVGPGLTYGMAVIGDRLYVLHGSDDAAGNGSVKVVDASARIVIGSIEVGSMPFAMAVSGRTLYVGNADDGTVSAIDARTNAVVDVIEVGAHPFGLEVAGGYLYVADLAGTVSVIDLADNVELVRIPVGGDPFGLAATADRVYVTNYAGDTVAVLDRTYDATDDADTVGYPYHAAVVGGRLYVVNVATNALTVVDGSTATAVDVEPATRALDAIPPDAAPVDMIVRGDRLYLSNIHRGTVTIVDVATNRPVENVAVGIQPGLMAASRDGRTVYVSDVMGGTVRVVTSVRHTARSTV